MKKTVILTFCSLIAFAAISQNYRADVKTPKGSNVAAWITEESSIQTRTYWDASVADSYPNAQQIKTYDDFSSSRRFNCHGYAWHMSELSNPLSEPRWIGYYADNTDEHIYWQDGSYVEVSQEVYPGKVSWASGDHSAVTTSEKGWFISKWNEYPLLKHRWDDSPYGTTNLKYYKKAPPPYSISGPTTICDQATYTIENLPAGATVEWSASNSNVEIVSGQGTGSAVFKKKNLGTHPAISITANIRINNVTLMELSKTDIQVGTIVPSMTLHDAASGHRVEFGYAGRTYYFEAQVSLSNNVGGFYQWEITSLNPDILPEASSGQKVYFTPFTSGTYTVSLRYHGKCGWGDLISKKNYHFRENSSFGVISFSLSPNPATDMVTVKMQEEPTKSRAFSTQSAGKKQDISENYEIQLWSTTNMVRKYTTAEKTYQISLSGLPKGLYFVHIVKDGEIVHRQKLIKN